MLELLKTEIVPPHIIIRKSSEYTLHDLDTAASAIKEIKKEFEVLEDYVDNHITNGVGKQIFRSFNYFAYFIQESVIVAEENMRRNRYRDMLPFDSNIVYLSEETGNPGSTYINASMVMKIAFFSSIPLPNVF